MLNPLFSLTSAFPGVLLVIVLTGKVNNTSGYQCFVLWSVHCFFLSLALSTQVFIFILFAGLVFVKRIKYVRSIII